MPRSSAKYHALKQISALLHLEEDLGDPLDRALELTRKVVDAPAASLVWMNSAQSRVTTWTSSRSGVPDISAEAEQVAMAALDGLNEDSCPQSVTVVLTQGGSERAVLVCDSAADPDKDFLQAVLSQLALSLKVKRENERADDSRSRADKRLSEVATLYEIGRAIHEVDLDRLLEMVTAKATAVMDAEACSLMLRDDATEQFTIRASCGLSDDVVRGARISYGEGISGRVAQTGEPMLLVDVGSDPRFEQGSVSSKSGISSSMCVPLKAEDGQVQGVLSIRRHMPSPAFTDDDLRLFCIFASQAALAISNSQLYNRLQKQIQEMATVSELLQATNSTLDLETVLSMIADSIVDVVGFDRCCVYLLDPRTNELLAGVRRGYGASQVSERVRLGDGLVGVAAKEQLPIFEEERPSGSPTLAAPMIVRDTCIGVVLVDNCPTGNQMQQSRVALLSTFVNQAGIAVENARLYEAMEENYAELNMLYEHGRAIGAAFGLDRASEGLVDAAIRASKADGGLLLLLNERRDALQVKACTGSCEGGRAKMEAVAAEPGAVGCIRGMSGHAGLSPSDYLAKGDCSTLYAALDPARAFLVAPLISEDASVGALILAKERAEFQPGETKLVSILASHAAAVIKNAVSYEHRMERKVLELSALHEFSVRISVAANLEEALDSILAMVSHVVECNESCIYAVDQDRGVLTPKAVRLAEGTPKQLPEEPLAGESVTSWSIRERKALVSPDIGADPRFKQAGQGQQPVRSLMSIPLMVQEEVVAVLNVHSYRPNLYSEDDVMVLSIIASQGAAIYRELEALSALTSYTDNILSSIAAGVITLDSEGTVLTWNSAAVEITDLQPEDVVGLHISSAIAELNVEEADKADTLSMINQVFKTGEVYHGYKVCFHPVGRDVMHLNMSISPLLNSVGEQLGLVIIFEDVTREMKMEEEFRRMGELAAVGQLAASIAHELRNPLASIKGAAQLLQEQYSDHPTIVEFLGIILEEVDALAKLTTEFLDFARPIQLELHPLDINAAVQKTLQLMSVQIMQSEVDLTERLAGDLPMVEADENQMEQVLRNIIINSLQAMPSGGSLEISTRRHSSFPEGVELIVSDTGVGIPPEKLDRIFVPFFTTKTKGTGLGLSVVQKIVENHGGRIEVSSEEGQGASFRVILPERSAAPPILLDDEAEQRRDRAELSQGQNDSQVSK